MKAWRAELHVQRVCAGQYRVWSASNYGKDRRLVAVIANTTERAPTWAITVGDFVDQAPGSTRPPWDAKGRAPKTKGTQETLKDATSCLTRWYAQWLLRHDPTPEEKVEMEEGAYTTARDHARDVAKHLPAVLRLLENGWKKLDVPTVAGLSQEVLLARVAEAEAEARAVIGVERARELDEQDIAQRMAELLARGSR